METATVVALIAAIGLPTVIGLSVKAFYERRVLAANAASSDATATAVVIAAARELVDPLRAELAEVRAESKAGVEVERRKLKEVRGELHSAMEEARALRLELAAVRRELEDCRAETHRYQLENTMYRARVMELEARDRKGN